MKMTEMIAEYPVMEWQGVRVRISVDVPRLGKSLTTQMILDERRMEDLRHIEMHDELRMRLEQSSKTIARMLLYDFDQKRERARSLLSQISDEIALQIAYAIRKEMNQ